MQMRLWWGLAEYVFGGSRESGGRFCVRAFGKNVGIGRHEDVSIFNSLYKETS
jgi:hypothetical protein